MFRLSPEASAPTGLLEILPWLSSFFLLDEHSFEADVLISPGYLFPTDREEPPFPFFFFPVIVFAPSFSPANANFFCLANDFPSFLSPSFLPPRFIFRGLISDEPSPLPYTATRFPSLLPPFFEIRGFFRDKGEALFFS